MTEYGKGGGRYFTDLLSFLKVESKWQIVQKVFMTETAGP